VSRPTQPSAVGPIGEPRSSQHGTAGSGPHLRQRLRPPRGTRGSDEFRHLVASGRRDG
jgi:hypothetical protein